jgi:hypothetical protein
MNCTCKYCKKTYDITDWEKILVSNYNGLDLDDVDQDEDISPFRLNIEINPSQYQGFGESGREQNLFAELYSNMCNECKKDLIDSLKLNIYIWKRDKGVL